MLRKRVAIGTTSGVLVVLLSLAAGAAPVPADLTTWSSFNQPNSGTVSVPNGSWSVMSGGTVAFQTVNGSPTFLVAPADADGYRITTSISAAGMDDDYFGFALGFSTDPSDPATDYLLVDWKHDDQLEGWGDGLGDVLGAEGLAVSRVTGVPTLGEMWSHTDSPTNAGGGVTELGRAANLGTTGWAPGVVYDLVVEYTTSSLDVWVNDSHEISLTGELPAGQFAIYNFSQMGVGYSAISFEALNNPPAVDGSGAEDVVVDEGETGTTSGSFSDPEGDHTLTLSCNGSCAGFIDGGNGEWSWSQLLPEGPASGEVTVTASDGEFEESDTFSVTVNNLAPVITATSSLPSSIADDRELLVTADFTDAGVLDTHTAIFDWGDGTESDGLVTESAGSGSATAGHSYSEPGLYTVRVTVWDDDGAFDSVELGEVFVFDPDDFVTGGGWVMSPGGAVSASPDHDGKTTFGFVARYTRDGLVRGSLQVQVHGALRFQAKTFDSLWIADGVAEFTGTGEVDGEGGYTFTVIATDERLSGGAEQDLFWIEINGPEGLVYGGAAYPSGLPIVGRGIQVHDRP